MTPIRRRFISIGLALLLLVGPQIPVTRAEGGGDPWLVRVLCRDEETFTRLVELGTRVITWWDGQLFLLADEAQRTAIAADGPGYVALDRLPSQGSYYVIWEFAGEAEALRLRYGTLADLGDGFYILGLPPGVELGPNDGPRYAHPLPYSMVAPQPASPLLLNPPPSPLLPQVVDAVSQERLTQTIALLQDDESTPGLDALGSRYTLSPGLDIKADYIAAELEAAGLQVTRQPFTYGRTIYNIVGTLPGLRPESEGVFIVCAHYDSTAGVTPGFATNWETMPAPGADDNGSGTAAVLEAARVLGRERPVYTIRFVLFAAEEQGTRGSEAYAAALAEAGENVLGVINMDMIAYDSNDDGVIEVHTGCTSASKALGQALVRNMTRYAPELEPEMKEVYANQISDQVAFWSRGYPALLLIEDVGQDFNFTYHRVDDTLRLLNMPYCTRITRAVVATLGELAQLQAPPDLSPSEKTASYDPSWGGEVVYVVTLRNSGPTTAHATLSDPLPPDILPSAPVVASQGTAGYDEAAHRVHWSGEVPPQGAVVITYRALLAPTLRGALIIRHSAWLEDGTGRTYELPAEASVAWRFVLPMISQP